MNTVNFDELNKSLINFKIQAEIVKESLTSMNNLVEENINTGAGIWDGPSASIFKTKWGIIKDEIPTLIDNFKIQADNLELFINTMKNTEE